MTCETTPASKKVSLFSLSCLFKLSKRCFVDVTEMLCKLKSNIAQLGRMIHHHVTFVYLAFNKEKSCVISYSSKKYNHLCTWLRVTEVKSESR